MDKCAQLAATFVQACSELTGYLSDQLKERDPQAHAALQDALSRGAQASVSLTVDVHGQQQISLDLIAGEKRVSVMQLNPRHMVRH